jgi:hypothetical protein
VSIRAAARTSCFRLCWLAIIVGVGVSLRADDRIVIDAKLNGQPFKLAFDTGAGALIVFRTFAEQRGLKISAPSPDAKVEPGKIPMGLSEPVTIEFEGSGQSITGQLSVLDDPSILNFFDIDGVIGWPVIRKNVWSLKGSTLQMTRLDEVPTETSRWSKLRERQDWETLCLELPKTGQGYPQYLGIDTGSDDDVELAPEAWKKWRTAHSKQPVTLEAYYMPGVNFVTGEIAWADEIDLGGLVLRGVKLRVMNQTEIAVDPPGTIAVLGLGAMKRLDSILDGKNGFAYLQPLRTPAPAPVHNLLGAVFVPADAQDGDDLLAHVAKNSPAEKAGVRNGDVLLKIDQRDVTSWRTEPGILPLRRFFEQAPGTKLQLTLRRNGKVVSIDAVLRNILGPEAKSR